MTTHTPLKENIETLTEIMGGSGKAKMIWEHLRLGEDPTSSDLLHNNLHLKARQHLTSLLQERPFIPNQIIRESVSSCGTRKLLLKLPDQMEIESVLIPSDKYDRTTLCVSTQIGCDRGCAFCLTGTMGLVRNLTSSEIIGQVIRGLEVSRRAEMPRLTNIVFMGMGDAGRNLQAVHEAVDCIVDRHRLAFSSGKVTVSTVGPSPEAFLEVAKIPATIAWSLHSADNGIRKKLVPNTRHTVEQLRDGLIAALLTRENVNKRTIMIAFTLIDQINDSPADASLIADFITPILAVAPKIAIDLIPYTDISVPGFALPSDERVYTFQQVLRQRGFYCFVRVTRGDEESAACGMLATKRFKKEKIIEQ